MAKVIIDGKLTKENRTRFLDCNVVEAAKERIRKILDRYDAISVSFSGGKDSLVVLHLTREVLAERGIGKVNVLFLDEELIPNVIVNFVDSYRQREWINMLWVAFPLLSQKHVLGKTMDYVQWDPNREHVRPKPAWALSDDSKVYSQYDMGEFIARRYKGKVCCLLGIRASESLTRYRAVVNKINETFVAASKHPCVDNGRPIYDWSEEDIFKYLYDNQIPYCDLYDWQQSVGISLRVSTPLHAESSRVLDTLREIDPEFYDRVLRVFPEVAVQGKYHDEVETRVETSDIPDLDSLEGWVRTNFDGELLKMALKRLSEVRTFWKDEHRKVAYPLNYVVEQFKKGKVKRVILPLDETGVARYRRKSAREAGSNGV